MPEIKRAEDLRATSDRCREIDIGVVVDNLIDEANYALEKAALGGERCAIISSTNHQALDIVSHRFDCAGYFVVRRYKNQSPETLHFAEIHF